MSRTGGAAATRFAHLFSSVTRKRGLDYFRDQRVQLLGHGDHGVFASVIGSGGNVYEVTVSVEPAQLASRCACLHFASGAMCKHVYATLLELDASLDEDRQASAAMATRAMSRRPRLSWRRLLEDVERAARSRPRRRLRSESPPCFAVDLEMSRARGHVALSTYVHRLKKDGAPGKARHPVELDRREVESWPPSPLRDALMPVVAGVIERSGSPYHYGYYAERERHILLGAGLAPEVLAALSASGRLFTIASNKPGVEPVPLRWDDGPAWRFEVAVHPVGDGTLRVDGQLVREGASLPLARPDLLLVEDGLVFVEGVVAGLDARAQAAWLPALRQLGSAILPWHELTALLARAVEAGAPLPALPPEVGWRERRQPPAGLVRLGPEAGPWAQADRLQLEVLFEYGGHLLAADEDDDQPHLLDIEAQEIVHRDLGAEAAILGAVERAGARRESGGFRSIPAAEGAALAAALLAAGLRVEVKGRPVRRPGAMRVKVASGVDWFGLEAGAEFAHEGGRVETVAVTKLLRAARDGAGWVRLKDGSMGLLPEAWLARWRRVLDLGEMEGERLRFRSPQALLVESLLAEHEDADVDRTHRRLVERLGKHAMVAPRDPPAGFGGTLREYQRQGLGWLAFLEELGFGGCLADDMGLGKTVQVLAHLAGRRRRGPSLVVVPKSLVFNWAREAARFTPALRVLDYTGADRRCAFAGHDLVITTYGTLRREVATLGTVAFDYVILDEAQAMKNAASQTAKCCRALRARHKLALTGTPVENHLGEAASIFEFLSPGLLGGVARGRDLAGADPDTARFIGRALAPFLLRRTKEQVLTDLPEKTEQTLWCELGGAQRATYDALREHYRQALLPQVRQAGVGRQAIQVLEALLRLRQAALHPGLIDKDRPDAESAKLDLLVEQLFEVTDAGHKSVVFSQFTELLALVRARLDARGLAYEYLDGRTRDRQRAVDRFQNDPTCPIFLVSLKAGGHGLNLTAADYVYLMDPWWNPAVEAQAIDRAHRFGQTRPVFAYRLVARDTVEEKILELQERKREVAAALLGEAGGLRGLSADDVAYLLG
jgi:superfamily II DNA or RNA helicase